MAGTSGKITGLMQSWLIVVIAQEEIHRFGQAVERVGKKAGESIG
jgi:hypothetical protein